MDPLAVAFEVNLCGRRRFAVQVGGLVLDNVAFLGFKQEVRQRLGRIGGEGFGEFAQTQEIVAISHCRKKKQICSLESASGARFSVRWAWLEALMGRSLQGDAAFALLFISIR